MRAMLSKLRRLELNLWAQKDWSASFTTNHWHLREALDAGKNLTDLTLKLQPPRYTNGNIDDRSGDCRPGIDVFTAVLASLYFPHLRLFHIQGWRFSVNAMQDFLKQHASSLRTLRIKCCDHIDNGAEFARWLSQNMRLDAVDFGSTLISRAGDGVDTTSIDIQSHLSSYPRADDFESIEDLALRGRQNFIVREPEPKIVGYSKSNPEFADDKKWYTRRLAW